MGLIPKYKVSFRNRRDLYKQFLHETPHGGIMISVKESLQIGEIVELSIKSENEEEYLRGVVLWCRFDRNENRNIVAGIGFLSTEVDKRERLLRSNNKKLKYSKERRYARYELPFKVLHSSEADLIGDYTKNISAGGCFIKSKKNLDIGKVIFLHFLSPGKEIPVELTGRVAWKHPGIGFGVQFVDVPKDKREKLEEMFRAFPMVYKVFSGVPLVEEMII